MNLSPPSLFPGNDQIIESLAPYQKKRSASKTYQPRPSCNYFLRKMVSTKMPRKLAALALNPEIGPSSNIPSLLRPLDSRNGSIPIHLRTSRPGPVFKKNVHADISQHARPHCPRQLCKIRTPHPSVPVAVTTQIPNSSAKPRYHPKPNNPPYTLTQQTVSHQQQCNPIP